MTDNLTSPTVSYGELARLFLRLSAVAFGGPVAHIAMMEDELVARRRWLTREHFLDLIAATNLIPGPNSTEVAIHSGYTLRGIPGALIAGTAFIFPAFVFSLILSVIYVSSGAIPQVNALLWGIKPVIIGIIAVAGYRLVRTALNTPLLWLLFGAALVVAGPLNVPEVLTMLGTGLTYAAIRFAVERPPFNGPPFAVFALAFGPIISPILQAAALVSPTLGDLFFYFLKIGAVLFGSGYVLIAYIQQDLIETFHWITAHQLLDAIAIGQVTPGPVSTAATVVGYLVQGFPGAIVATVGVFLPSFVFVILSAPLIPKMRRSVVMGNFLTGVNAGVVAAILVTVLVLANEALRSPDGALSPIGLVLFAATLIALIRFRLNATWMIALGALVGLLVNPPL